jgi:predicted  nucleic acid-binding Zn-ribbon protein
MTTVKQGYTVKGKKNVTEIYEEDVVYQFSKEENDNVITIASSGEGSDFEIHIEKKEKKDFAIVVTVSEDGEVFIVMKDKETDVEMASIALDLMVRRLEINTATTNIVEEI